MASRWDFFGFGNKVIVGAISKIRRRVIEVVFIPIIIFMICIYI